MASLRAPPAISRNTPKLETLVTPAMVAVPDFVKVPLVKGVPAAGRMRRFCQVKEQTGPLLLVTVKVS